MPNIKQRSIIGSGTTPDEIVQNLLKFGGCKVTNFGAFNLKTVKAHSGFNPYTQKKQNFPTFVKVNFTPTKTLKLKIQKWK